jgi:hypothetical protein
MACHSSAAIGTRLAKEELSIYRVLNVPESRRCRVGINKIREDAILLETDAFARLLSNCGFWNNIRL